MVTAIASGNVQGALWQLLNEKATVLHGERERLLIEGRRLKEQLTPLSENFDAGGIEAVLRDFSALARYAAPEELQRLLRLTIRRVEWKTQGNPKVQFYHLTRRNSRKTNCPPAPGAGGQWLYTDVCNDISKGRGMKPLSWSLSLLPKANSNLKTLLFGLSQH